MPGKKVVLFCFFLSGATGLMYEIMWTRYFSLTFGSSTYSISTVLAAFMAGLALGSVLFGRIADRIERRVLLYGRLELMIGLYALLFPLLYGLSSRVYLFLVDPGTIPDGSKLIVKFALSFSIMMVPTTLMGGTLPVLSRAFISDLRGVSSGLGLLYALNTFGAVAGTYLVGFHLLSTIGMHLTMILAAATNIAIGAAMMRLGGKLRIRHAGEEHVPSPGEAEPLPAREKRIALFAVLAFMVSGFVSLSHQVVWTRILALIIGSSTYAFTMILIGFLLGIALGSALFRHTGLIPPERIGLQTFAWIEVAIGLSVFLLIPLFSKLPYLMLKAFHLHGDSYAFITFSQFLVVLMIVILPTALMGATFPVIAKIVSREVRSLGRSIGDIYFFNTFGAIFGPLFAGFLFIPRLGTLNTLKLGIGLNILLGLGAMLLSAERMRFRRAHVAFLLLSIAGLAGLLKTEWDPRLMDSGVTVYGKKLAAAEGIDKLKDGSRVLFLEEGVNATISVRKNEEKTTLHINGKVDAGTGRADMATQLLSGHLPVMAHADPRRALLIGLGSGVTARAIAQHAGIESLDVVEIEPAVARASEFFEEVNHRVLDSPKVNLLVNDGRNHLLETDRIYDIIVSEPSNPWISGVSSLYTVDYYRLVREKLSEGGVFCQWIHCYSMSVENLAMVMRTMALAFEDVQLWTSTVGDLLLLASGERIAVSPDRVREVVRSGTATEEEFLRFLMVEEPLDLFGRLLLDRHGIASFSEGARTNSDDHPYLEFLAPRDLYRNDVPVIYNTILKLSDTIPPEPLSLPEGRALLPHVSYHRSRLFDVSPTLSERYAREALAQGGTGARYHVRLGEVLMRKGAFGEAEEVLMKGLDVEKTPYALRVLADLMIETGRIDEALRLLESNRDVVEGFEELYGSILFEAQECGRAIPYLDRALARGQGQEYLMLERLGRCLESVGEIDAAKERYRKSLEKNEMNSRVQYLLGEMHWREGKFDEAAVRFRFLADHWSVKRLIYERLADCYAKLNRHDEARHIREKVLPRYSS